MKRGDKLLVTRRNSTSYEKTSAFVLSPYKVAVGTDVWRMGNKMDFCSYPFEILDTKKFKTLFEEVAA